MQDSSFQYSGNEVLESIDLSFKEYSHFFQKEISRLANKFDTSMKILDFGAGHGTLALKLKLENNLDIECYEIDDLSVKLIKSKGLNCHSNLNKIEKGFGLIYSINVLEHIKNDVHDIASFQNLLSPNGQLFIFVPAFQKLYNDFDLSLGHYRRYEKKELKKKLETANLQIMRIEYVDVLGFYAWKMIKKRETSITSKDKLLLKIYAKLVWPISRSLDQLGFNKILGKNLLVVAQKFEDL